MKACRLAQKQLEQQFAGELDWKQDLQLQQHLEVCSECAALASAQKQILESLDSYREAPLARVDVERFVARVQDRIAEVPVGSAALATNTPVSHKRYWAMAAMVLVAMGLAWALRSAPQEPTPVVGVDTEMPVLAKAEPVGASDFRADRHRAAVLDLRGALASLMGDAPNRELYRNRVQGLRSDGWPMVSLLSGLLGEDSTELALAAVAGLGEEDSRQAYRKLWMLRKDERLAQTALQELQARGQLSLENVIDLYWAGSFDSIVEQARTGWQGPTALRAAQLLVDSAPNRRVPVAAYGDLAEWLGRADAEGAEQGLDWLQDSRWEQGPWAMELASAVDLSASLDAFIARESGARWESSAMALAAHLPDERWVPFLETRCGRSRTASRAVERLASQPGLPALELLLAQERNRMVPEEIWLSAWNQALEVDGPRLLELIRLYRAEHPRNELEHLADVLLLGDFTGSSAALVELARADGLAPRLRCALVSQAGHLGDAGAEFGLRALFETLQRADSELAACITLALGQIMDSETLSEWLEGEVQVHEPVRSGILALCDPQSRRSERERRYLIARKLKPILGRRNLVSLE